jgi:hypothetical protein
MSPYEESVFWVGKFEGRQEVCSWFRDFEGNIVIYQIRERLKMIPQEQED